MAIGDLTSLPTPIQNLLQQNMLARGYQNALRSVLAYSNEADHMEIMAQIGATIAFTKLGELPASRQALDPASMTGLDNGLSTDALADEQYLFKLANFARTFDIDLIAQKAIIGSYTMQVVERQGRQAGRIREAVARYKLMAAYTGGNTVVTNKSAATTTQCAVDDVTGFQQLMKDGNWQNVSASGGLQLVVNDLTNTTITLNITGVTPDSTAALPEFDVANTSSRKREGGVSGILIYQTVGVAPSVGDILQAVNASTVIRPNGKQSTQALQPGDLFTTSQVMQGKQLLHARGVLPYEDGFYRCIVPPSTMTQLFADADFKQASQGQLNSQQMRTGQIVTHQGVMYIETTEAIVRQKGDGANGAALPVSVNSPLLLGKGAIVRGDFKGLEEFAAEQQEASKVHEMKMIDGVCYSLRSPIDRLGRQMVSSHQMIYDYSTPGDTTSTPALVPTTDNAAFKLGVKFEHVA